jgi:hypothetical protein
MNILFQAILEGVKKHGVVFLVLLALILYFHGQNEKLERKFDMCNSQVIEMYQRNNTQLIETVERNSAALEKITGNN